MSPNLIVFIYFLIPIVVSQLVQDPEIATKISKFRKLARSEIFPVTSLTHQCIDDDYYVNQWLSESDYKVHLALEQFIYHLKWRKTEHIDRIHLENWDYWKTEYPQYINLPKDNSSKIIVGEVWWSDWNMRKAVFGGRSQKLIRWAVYLVEMVQRDLCQRRQNATKNETITQAVEIVDVDGWNAWNQGCIPCINMISVMGSLCEKHYPGLWRNVYMINAGPVFRQFLTTFGRAFKTLSSGVMRIYTREHEWMSLLNREMVTNQKSRRFGGNILRDI